MAHVVRLHFAKYAQIALSVAAAMMAIIVPSVDAAESYQINASQEVTVDEHGVCKKVTNNHSSAIFVPTKTDTEWGAFRTNATLIALADCAAGACTPGSQVFNTGDNQNFVVPANCTSVSVKAWGAGGDFGDADGVGGDGGGGGYAGATLTVTPSETLKVRVGSPGGGQYASDYGWGGNGGGSSSVLRGTTVLIEAGGGGGAAAQGPGGAGGGIRACASPGNQAGQNATPGSECGGGGAGYCRGSTVACGGEGGSSYVPAGGVELPGSGSTPGNAGDPDRGTAGDGSIWINMAGTPLGAGKVKISW